MFKIYAMALAGAVSVISGGSAAAITMKATFTGTVSNSSNAGGLFDTGTGAGALNGKTAVIEFVYDPSLLGANKTANGTDNVVNGGTGATPVAPNPMLSSSVTINGVTQFLNGSYYGQAQNTHGAKSSLLYQRNSTAEYGGSIDILLGFNSGYIPYSLETPIAYTLLTGNPDLAFAFGGFFFVAPGCNGNIFNNCAATAEGSLTFTSFEVAAVETPLPAALPLFATVLAGGGLVAWRRKRKAAKVAA